MATENPKSQAHALEALARLMGDPAPKVMHGSKTVPGVFHGAAASDKAAAKICLDRGWLQPSGQTAGKGTKKDLYRLSAAGLQAVLERSDPGKLLHGLQDHLAQLKARTSELAGFVQDKLEDVAAQVGSLRSNLDQVKLVVDQAVERVKPLDVAQLAQKLSQHAPSVQPDRLPPSDPSWHDEVVALVKAQKQQNSFQRLTIPKVFATLRSKNPGLTLGQFHDGLRKLQDDKRIRLGPFTQALATIDDPRTALFLDREVKYYVDLP